NIPIAIGSHRIGFRSSRGRYDQIYVSSFPFIRSDRKRAQFCRKNLLVPTCADGEGEQAESYEIAYCRTIFYSINHYIFYMISIIFTYYLLIIRYTAKTK